MASCGYGTGCYGTMVGIGTTGGFSIVLASSPWLVARVLAYLRIATVAARIAAAVHACMVWLVCVAVTYGKYTEGTIRYETTSPTPTSAI